jgi:hypothetical protein
VKRCIHLRDSIEEEWLTTTKSERLLNPRGLEIYREHRRDVLTWLLDRGKHPESGIGYAAETVKSRGDCLDLFMDGSGTSKTDILKTSRPATPTRSRNTFTSLVEIEPLENGAKQHGNRGDLEATDLHVEDQHCLGSSRHSRAGRELHADYNAARNIAHRYIQNRLKSGSGGATHHLALKSGTLNENGDYSPSAA